MPTFLLMVSITMKNQQHKAFVFGKFSQPKDRDPSSKGAQLKGYANKKEKGSYGYKLYSPKIYGRYVYHVLTNKRYLAKNDR